MEHDVRCDCVVAPVEDGWRETRGPVCEARDRAEWREFMEWLDAGLVEFAAGIGQPCTDRC